MNNRQRNKAHQLVSGAMIVAAFLAVALALLIDRYTAPTSLAARSSTTIVIAAGVLFLVGVVWWIVARLVAWWQD